jgi:hypothetical protein
MREGLSATNDGVRRNSHVVFHGEVDLDRAPHLRDDFPGLILRSVQGGPLSAFDVNEGPEFFVAKQRSS